MKVNQRSLLACAVGSVLGIAATAAWSQEQAGRSTSVLEEIVVTAQKRSQSLQEVPIAVSAFTDQTRDLMGVTSITDLTDFTPGLTYSLTQDRMSLRGVGRLSNNYGSDPGIANYSDGFYTASTVEAGKRPIIVDRIEVLRGPQGTLYGRNSIGGAINIISKRPTEKFAGEVRATAGNYDTSIFEGSLSGPLTDWLRYRIAGNYGGNEEGYFRDLDGDSTEGSLRNQDLYVEGQLAANFGENIEAWFKYAHAEWNQSRRTLVTITPRDFAPIYFSGVSRTGVPPGTPTFTPSALNPNVTYNGGTPTAPLLSAPFLDQNPALADRRVYDTDRPMEVNLDNVHIFTLELQWHLSGMDIKYIGGYQGYTYEQFSDFDNTDRVGYTTLGFNPLTPTAPPAPLFISTQLEGFYQEDKEYYSNEINLISTHDGPLQWILGLYQYHEQVYQFLGYRGLNQPQLENPRLLSPFGAPGPANPERNYSRAGANLDADARAVFAQLDWQFADNWKATLGARYTEDNKDADEFRTRVFFGIPAGTIGAPGGLNSIPLSVAFYVPGELNRTNHLSGDWDAVTGTAGLQWTPSDATLLFAKYTRGYKSGGFNAGELAAADLSYTDPEHINAYELGVKETFADALTANLSLFYYDYQDAQVPLSVLDPATQLTSSPFFNIEAAEALGAELETVWAVNDALELRLTYSYLTTEIKDDSLCVADSADRLATAPQAQPCGSIPGRVFQSLDGNDLPASPEHKIAFNANYTWQLPGGSFTLSGNWTYKDSAYYDLFSRDYYQTPSYDETDFRALWHDAGNRYTIIAFVRNAFDDEGYERADATQSSWLVQSRQLALTEPRTYGIEAQFRFGN